ncbi:MAG: hypothetical protein FJY80_02675 [Candidatus Aminicenantes bacterium]|nr:hypothetical protein [Candidatus Aminicenantes bacterium]
MSHSRKSWAFFATGLSLVLLVSTAGQAQGLKFGFKFTGGMGFQLGGDDTANLRGLKSLVDHYVESTGLKLKSNAVPFMNRIAFEFDADVVLNLTPQFGVSLGTGYIRAGTLFGSGKVVVLHGSEEESSLNSVAASAMPIKLGVVYTFGSMFAAEGKQSSYVFGGIGLYSAKHFESEDYSYQATRTKFSSTSKATGIGFYGGLGSENWINPNFAFVLELYGRYAKIGGFEGDWEQNAGGAPTSGKGKLYYYEWQDDDNNWYPATTLSAQPPSAGASVRNVREARIDFSGLGIRFGVRISLGTRTS